MKKVTQKDTNPYRYSDTNKRYYTYDYYLRHRYGGKCVKLTLDAGFTCPNIDGRCGRGGCIYCSGRGSGDFTQSFTVPLREQYERQRLSMSSKWDTSRCIPYLQAHTNTYAPLERVREICEEVITFEGAVGLNIATRADCLPDDIVEYLADLSNRCDLTIELGLQSVHDETARRINRGHTYADFLEGYNKLRAHPKIRVCVHLIDGLPGEDADMMAESAVTIGRLHPDEIKFHLLHVLRGTRLCEMYEQGLYTPLTLDEYADIIVRQLTEIPEDIVVGRVTGDGAPDILVAPDWSRKKFEVIDTIDRRMYEYGLYQGCRFKS